MSPGARPLRPRGRPAHGVSGGLASATTLDEPGAQAVLDRLISDFTLAAALHDVLVPYLREVGERWATGDVTIVQEHFASNVIRGGSPVSPVAGGMAKGRGLSWPADPASSTTCRC